MTDFRKKLHDRYLKFQLLLYHYLLKSHDCISVALLMVMWPQCFLSFSRENIRLIHLTTVVTHLSTIKYAHKIESGQMVSHLMTTMVYDQTSMLNCGHTLRTVYTHCSLWYVYTYIFPGQQTKLSYVQLVVPSELNLSAWMLRWLSIFM